MHAFAKVIGLGLLLAAATPTEALSLDPDGLGQVLIYPLYSVNAGNQTLLSVVNTTGYAKALRVRVHEGYNGRDVLDFNVYLGAQATWVATVAAPTATGAGLMLTPDTSCTVPAFLHANPPAPLPAGVGYAPLVSYAYTGSSADGGPATGDRTRIGYIEVFEMGSVKPGSPTDGFLQPVRGGTGIAGCASLLQAWQPGGYWLADPATDLVNPTGGLYGAAAIVDVANGTMHIYAATAGNLLKLA